MSSLVCRSVIVETVTIQSHTPFSEGFKPVFILAHMLFIHSYKTPKFTLYSLVRKDKVLIGIDSCRLLLFILLSFLVSMSMTLVGNCLRGKHESSYQTSFWLTAVAVKPLPHRSGSGAEGVWQVVKPSFLTPASWLISVFLHIRLVQK